MARPKTDTRERLLDAAISVAAEHGISQMILRQLAEHLGTSHRMLVFHFGSKDALLLEIVRAVEARQRAFIAPPPAGRGAPVAPRLDELWVRLRDPKMWPYERLFFELYGQALQGREPAGRLLDGDVAAWVDTMAGLLVEIGVDEATARTDARLALAVCRGLLLDLLAAEAADQVDAAMQRFGAFLTAAHPGLRPAGPGSR